MKFKKLLSALICITVICTTTPITVGAEAPDEGSYIENEIIISTAEPLTNNDFGTFSVNEAELIPAELEENGVTEITPIEMNTESITPESSDYYYTLEIEDDVWETCKKLNNTVGIIYAEPNYIYHTMDFTMPGEIDNSESYYNLYQKWYLDDVMHFPKAWESYEATGEGVVVAVIDNGFFLEATDFPTNLWTDANGNHGWNTYKNSADISPIYKSDGTVLPNTSHGSNVAGVIGMASNTKNGIGAAYGAELMLINAAHYKSDTEGSVFTIDDIAEAITYAHQNGAKVINLSVGGDTVSSTMEIAINNAVEYGVTVIAAAGNYAKSTAVKTYYPAGFDNVIGVMATDKDDTTQLAYFSNYDPSGEYYDIAAPGVNILGCAAEGGKLCSMSGTSQATPLISACAALYFSRYPDATPAEFKNALIESADTGIKTNSQTAPNSTAEFKVANAYELLRYGRKTPEIIQNPLSPLAATADSRRGFIYGLEESYDSIEEHLTVENGSAVFTPTSNGNGTGSIYDLYSEVGDLYKTYRIVIFGDLNGDCISNGEDAILAKCLEAGMIESADYLAFAADVDFDDTLSEYDIKIIADYAIGLDWINQQR